MKICKRSILKPVNLLFCHKIPVPENPRQYRWYMKFLCNRIKICLPGSQHPFCHFYPHIQIKSSPANSSRASGVAKQLISPPRAAHPRGAFDLFPVKSKSLLLKSSRLPNFLINYAFFCGNTLRSTNHRDPVMQTEEYVPQRIPAISGSANSFTEETPNTYNAATMIKVVREVNTLRDKVWVILVFTISSRLSFLLMFCMFSRTRSKITMVALME